MRIAYFVFIFLVIFLTACTAPVTDQEPTEVSEIANSEPTEEIEVASPMQEEVKGSLTPEITAALIETTLPTIEPTSTPLPEKTRWHWVFSPNTSEIQVVNQVGEVRSIGTMDLIDVYDYRLLQFNEQQALFFTLLNGKPVIKMFGLENVQDVSLPAGFVFDQYMFTSSIQMVGSSDNYGYFVFATEASYGTSGGSYPEKGPLYQVDLNSSSMKLIDSNVYQSRLDDPRYYFFQSEDGENLRYFKMQDSALLINEVELSSGAIRTITQTTGSPDIVSASEFGDSFFLPRSELYIESEGRSKSFSNSQSLVRLLISGEVILLPSNCLGPCEVEVSEPISGVIMGTFTVPWSTSSYSRLGTRLLPDGSLLWVGAPKRFLLEPPATSDDFPELSDEDRPVFRISSDGNYQLIGVRPLYDLWYSNRYPVSSGGRYLLLKSYSASEYFIYDSIENKKVLYFPQYENWIYEFGSVNFYPEGIFVQFFVSSITEDYSQFLSFLNFNSGEFIFWEESEANILFCPDFFEDGTIACWVQRENLNSDLVRFKPGSENSKILIEDVYVLESDS